MARWLGYGVGSVLLLLVAGGCTDDNKPKPASPQGPSRVGEKKQAPQFVLVRKSADGKTQYTRLDEALEPAQLKAAVKNNRFNWQPASRRALKRDFGRSQQGLNFVQSPGDFERNTQALAKGSRPDTVNGVFRGCYRYGTCSYRRVRCSRNYGYYYYNNYCSGQNYWHHYPTYQYNYSRWSYLPVYRYSQHYYYYTPYRPNLYPFRYNQFWFYLYLGAWL